MRDLNMNKKQRYITLDEESSDLSKRWTLSAILETRSTQLSGKNRGWGWTHPGVKIRDGGKNNKALSNLDFTSLLPMLFKGLSLLFVGLGFYSILGRRREGEVG
jgi:hypothetical protein